MKLMSTTRFELAPFEPADLLGFTPQPAQAEDYQWIDTVNWTQYFKTGFAVTALIDGEPVCVGGINQILPRIGDGWLLISDRVSNREMLYLFKAFKSILQSELQTAYDRVQMTVDADFAPAIRMARMLGMEQEGAMKSYPKEGKTSYLYARTS